MADDETRRRSPPPSYEEAISDQPPPIYSENPNQESFRNPEIRTPSQRISRVLPIVTSPENVIVRQPGQQIESMATTQPRKKQTRCNCLCSALQWTPCTCDCELFCFNCLGFLSYMLLCAPGVYLCWGCKKICPDTFGECYTRNTSLMERYDDRDDNIVSRAWWFCFGPCCCFSCDGETEVLPCSDPCVKRCGVCAVLKKMTCYCGSYKMCDFNLNVMDEQAFGFICDCKEVGCKCS